MFADDFAQRLNASVSSFEDGASLRCELRSPRVVERDPDPICDLVARYQMNSIELGLVCFLDAIQSLSGKVWFGNAEADPLVINPADGRVEVLDHARVDHVMALCAASSGMFLDAMVTGVEAACSEHFEWTDGLQQVVLAAGGEEYRGFYTYVLGWDVLD